MPRTRRDIATRFLRQFEADRGNYELAALQATELLKEVLVNSPALIHVIASRCKKTDSLWLKLREKRYGQPKRQCTDLVAARVITYYQKDVPTVVRALYGAFEIDPHRSVNKRIQLAAIEFGYTSVHLIARIKGGWATSPKYFALRNRWIEIQVRSILEHAWAEIEHEVVYKSGIKYPPSIKRRFARIAGAIELLEDEFIALHGYKEHLIDSFKEKYLSMTVESDELDPVRLVGILECERPDSPGWRSADSAGSPLPPHIDDRCVKALRQAGLRTVRALRAMLDSPQIRAAEATFASVHRMSEPPSHLNVARLAVLQKSRATFLDYFPEMASDPGIMRILEEKKRKKR